MSRLGVPANAAETPKHENSAALPASGDSLKDVYLVVSCGCRTANKVGPRMKELGVDVFIGFSDGVVSGEQHNFVNGRLLPNGRRRNGLLENLRKGMTITKALELAATNATTTEGRESRSIGEGTLGPTIPEICKIIPAKGINPAEEYLSYHTPEGESGPPRYGNSTN